MKLKINGYEIAPQPGQTLLELVIDEMLPNEKAALVNHVKENLL